MLAGDVPKQVSLMSLKQISDVLLVHDQRALLTQPLTVGLGYIKLVGTAVKTADGKVIGKVWNPILAVQGAEVSWFYKHRNSLCGCLASGCLPGQLAALASYSLLILSEMQMQFVQYTLNGIILFCRSNLACHCLCYQT